MNVRRRTFKKGKLLVNGKSIEAIQKEIYNPFRKHTKMYEGYHFIELLDQVYGPKWREADTMTFSALDGFVQTTPIKKMLERANDHTGLLSYKETGHQSFSPFEKNGKNVDPGPFYLVWNRFDGRSVANFGDFLKWPYQLKSIKVLKTSK